MAHVVKPEFDMQDMYEMNCSPMSKCIPQENIIKDVRLAAAYVPYQKLCTLFSTLEALSKGTTFPELYSPYEGKDKKYKSTGWM